MWPHSWYSVTVIVNPWFSYSSELLFTNHITVALETLHWLPVHQRTLYKLCITDAWYCLRLHFYLSTRCCHTLLTLPGRVQVRSADSGQYDSMPLVGKRGISCPHLFIRCVMTFKCRLKARLFMEAYCASE